MQSLRFVANAISHAESLADEATDLNLGELSTAIWKHARRVSESLDDAVSEMENVKPAKHRRDSELERLKNAYTNATCRLQRVVPANDVYRFCPGGNLNIAERVRFRLRQISLAHHHRSSFCDELTLIASDLRKVLDVYEQSVDDSLLALGRSHAKRNMAILQSQKLRLHLEQAKFELLQHTPPGSQAWNRIKKRTVRTRRAQWLEEMILSDGATSNHL